MSAIFGILRFDGGEVSASDRHDGGAAARRKDAQTRLAYGDPRKGTYRGRP
jgi:hypothetical protein